MHAASMLYAARGLPASNTAHSPVRGRARPALLAHWHQHGSQENDTSNLALTLGTWSGTSTCPWSVRPPFCGEGVHVALSSTSTAMPKAFRIVCGTKHPHSHLSANGTEAHLLDESHHVLMPCVARPVPRPACWYSNGGRMQVLHLLVLHLTVIRVCVVQTVACRNHTHLSPALLLAFTLAPRLSSSSQLRNQRSTRREGACVCIGSACIGKHYNFLGCPATLCVQADACLPGCATLISAVLL